MFATVETEGVEPSEQSLQNSPDARITPPKRKPPNLKSGRLLGFSGNRSYTFPLPSATVHRSASCYFTGSVSRGIKRRPDRFILEIHDPLELSYSQPAALSIYTKPLTAPAPSSPRGTP